MAANFHVFVLTGTGSGCGKITVTLGLLSLLKEHGLRVQPRKVGPDYLDIGWHTAVRSTVSRNLDSFMLPTSTLNALFNEQMQHADIAAIEGVMGLYDGYGTDPNYCSIAATTKQLGCPTTLLADGKAVSTSIVATVIGFQHFDPTLNITGVIANRVSSETHYQLLKIAIERCCNVPILGYVPRMEGTALPERHLGLVTARESVIDQQPWQTFATTLEQILDVDTLLTLGRSTSLSAGEWPALPAADAGVGLTTAIADDEAFNFYCPDSITLLERMGLNIVRFSPLYDTYLPDCQMIWLDGRYPELHAVALVHNVSMLNQLREAYQRGVVIYIGRGGLMHLGSSLEDSNGNTWLMANIIPGHSKMGKCLTRSGYCETQVTQQTLPAAEGEVLCRHKFHYSDFTPETLAVMNCRKVRDGKTL